MPATTPNIEKTALGAFERRPYLPGPSPLHHLDRLSEHLGISVWAKREDFNSPVGLGGNKLRKMEYLVADALAKGRDTLVTVGGIQSNHTRIVAGAGAAAGLKVICIQENWVDWPDGMYDRVGNILLSRIMGADVRIVQSGFDIGSTASYEHVMREVEDSGGRPYAVPAGASDHPLGGLGFARFAFELAAQERAHNVFFDTIILATGTGSTQAGMLVGFAMLEQERTLLGVDITARPHATRQAVERIKANTAETLGVDASAQRAIVREEWAGPAYGIPSDETVAAIRLAGSLEGMLLDTVYEGKSMAALVDLVSTGEIDRDAQVLFVHLGGVPALHAYTSRFS